MEKLFSLLEAYKDQIGLLIQVGLLIATAVLIYVGFRQAKAAIAQAKAADAQVVAAKAQSATAQNQFNLDIKQLYANLSAADAATRPILKFSPPTPEQLRDYSDDSVPCTILNCGLGPALNLAAFYGKDSNEAAGLYGEFLGVESQKNENFDLNRFSEEGLTIHYSSTQGSRYETFVTYHADFGFMQFHKLIKNPFDQMLDEDLNAK